MSCEMKGRQNRGKGKKRREKSAERTTFSGILLDHTNSKNGTIRDLQHLPILKFDDGFRNQRK
jgi:hypothetical protein